MDPDRNSGSDLPDSEDQELIYEEAERPSEIIAACFNAIGIVDGYDIQMATKADQKRIEQIRRWALRLTHDALKSIYETNIEQDEIQD